MTRCGWTICGADGRKRYRGSRFHIRGGLQAIPLKHHDLVPGPRQQQLGEQACGTAPAMAISNACPSRRPL